MRTLKICFVGEAGVGKTSIANRYVRNVFNPNITLTTVGAHYLCKSYDATTHLEIWDTAGQERYRAIVPLYLRRASAVIVVVDLTSPKDRIVADARRWIQYVREEDEKCPIVVALNKADLVVEDALDDRDLSTAIIGTDDNVATVAAIVRTTPTKPVDALFDLVVRQCNDVDVARSAPLQALQAAPTGPTFCCT